MSCHSQPVLILLPAEGRSRFLINGKTPTIAGCLKNAQSVASAAMGYGSNIAVIPSGERWGDRSLRPALEDWIGAGAVLSYLEGHFSPEAELAVADYQTMHPNLGRLMKQCGSGQELIGQGFEQDVHLALQLNTSNGVPTLVNGAYINKRVST